LPCLVDFRSDFSILSSTNSESGEGENSPYRQVDQFVLEQVNKTGSGYFRSAIYFRKGITFGVLEKTKNKKRNRKQETRKKETRKQETRKQETKNKSKEQRTKNKKTKNKKGNKIIYQIGGNRYCHRIGRPHRSNHVIYIADLELGIMFQKCLDPDCRQENFRSTPIPIPQTLLPFSSPSSSSSPSPPSVESLFESISDEQLFEEINNNPHSWD